MDMFYILSCCILKSFIVISSQVLGSLFSLVQISWDFIMLNEMNNRVLSTLQYYTFTYSLVIRCSIIITMFVVKCTKKKSWIPHSYLSVNCIKDINSNLFTSKRFLHCFIMLIFFMTFGKISSSSLNMQ